MRGTASCPLVPWPQGRITPACAGNSRISRLAAFSSRDHPRVCGEQCSLDFETFLHEGSPPRVRGTAARPKLSTSIVRITPACAGNSYFRFHLFCGQGDHPRVCGEQTLFRNVYALHKGSPPRVRGTGNLDYGGRSRRGITPACAGNSQMAWRSRAPRRDHPRVCGEQIYITRSCSRETGSPPRVRGTD